MKNKTIIAVASAFLAMLVIYIVMLLVSNYRLREQVRSQTEALAAYGYLIHDIWWDNPEYFDRNIRTKRSFYDVNQALEGDWEDIFYEW